MEEKLKQSIEAVFPDNSDQKFQYLTRFLESRLQNYKMFLGYHPNINFLTCAFFDLLGIKDLDLGDIHVSFHKPLRMLEGHTNKLLGYTETEIFSVITPFRCIGYDGGGGTIYASYSSLPNKGHNTYEEFDHFNDSSFLLTEVLEKIDARKNDLYKDLVEYHRDKLALHRESDGSVDYEMLTSKQAINLSIGFTVSNADYMKAVESEINLNYFLEYLENESSAYYQFDAAVAYINSSLIAYCCVLFMKDEIEKLEVIYSKINLIKGRSISNYIAYLFQFVKTKRKFKKDVLMK